MSRCSSRSVKSVLTATRSGRVAATSSVLGFQAWLERDPDEVQEEALKLGAVVPTLICALWRLSQGQQPIDPDPNLDEASNYLWMMNGEKPSDDQVLAVSRYLILLAEHGMNASMFTARVTAATLADIAQIEGLHREASEQYLRRGTGRVCS